MSTNLDPKRKVQTPLLKAYLESAPGTPPHVPAWVPWAGWIVFGVLFFGLEMLPFMRAPGFFGSALAGYAVYALLMMRYRPRNDAERADEKLAGAVALFQHAMQNGDLHKRLPPEVLESLERAVASYNAAIVRLYADGLENSAADEKRLEKCLQGCLLTAQPLYRTDNHSRKDWNALLENRELIGHVVDTIEAQTLRIREGHGSTPERLAALRELESFRASDELQAFE